MTVILYQEWTYDNVLRNVTVTVILCNVTVTVILYQEWTYDNSV